MKLDVDTLKRVSQLLDEVLDLDRSERAEWLDRLESNQADLAPIVRELLAKESLVETDDILQRGPNFTGPSQDAQRSDFNVGDSIGPYRLIRELGFGGMGEVWLAERSDGVLKRSVALKLPLSSLRRSVLVQRFERERDILGSLTHPHIARLYDAGFAESGQPYLALEYVEGVPITEFVRSNALDARARIALLLQVMNAVQYAHANLVIHRDLKPGNVLVTPKGQAQLLDFGIAKLLEEDVIHAHETELTRLGGRAFTLMYAAPEQVAGRPVSIATDVWALGVLLYELIADARPFNNDRNALAHDILNAEPIRPRQHRSGPIAKLPRSYAADIETIVLKALKKTPSERYATVGAMAEDLERWSAGEPVRAQPDSAGYRMRKFVGRHRTAVAAATAAATALVVFTAALMSEVNKVTRERDRADQIALFLTDTFKVSDASEQRSGQVTARELLDTASGNLKGNLNSDPELRAEFAQTMGRAYSGLGALKQSETLLRSEYEQAQHTLGLDAAPTLALGRELAITLGLKWESLSAENLLRDILEKQRHAFGTENAEVAKTESELGFVLTMQGKFEEALALKRHSISVAHSTTDTEVIDQLNREAEVGYAMARAGKVDPKNLEPTFRARLEANRTKYGKGSTKSLEAAIGMGILLSMQGRSAEEVPMLEQAIADAKAQMGEDHPRILDAMNNLAGALIDSGDLKKGEQVLEEVIARIARVEGTTNSPRAALSKYNLACIKARLGETVTALNLLRDAVDHGLIPDAALQMANESDLNSLHGDARFVKLIQSVKLRYGDHQQ